MARLEHLAGAPVVIAETAAERELLQDSGGEVVLSGGLYPIRDREMMLLPEGISEASARRLCQTLELAASSHREARLRREGFRVVKSD